LCSNAIPEFARETGRLGQQISLRVNNIDIGFDLRRGSTLRDVPEEALMLTGDENRPAGRRIPSGRCE